MKIYQIRDWDKHFENNKSRERDACSFVCIPNKHHGLGFSRVVAEKDGASIYGIWVMIVQVCSRQKLPRDGWLTDDGHRTGTAWAPEDLSIQIRRPTPEIERALAFLSSPKIGWLNCLDTECPSSVAQVPAECPSGALEEKGREEKGMEGNGSPRTHQVEATVPTVEEVIAFGQGRSLPTPARLIPEDYARHFHAKKTEENGWFKNGRLIVWTSQICRWWSNDEPSWGQRTKTGANGHQSASKAVYNMESQKKNIEETMIKLRDRFAHESPTGVVWDDPEKRKEYFAFKKQREEIVAKLAAGVNHV